MSLLVIGDVGGQLSALTRLVESVGCESVLCVGDLVDRGPESAGVIQYCMDRGIKSLVGNHEEMMLEFFRTGDPVWFRNGGRETLKSYGYSTTAGVRNILRQDKRLYEHLNWVRSLPLYHQEPGLVVTHAAISPAFDSSSWMECLNNDHDYEYGNYVLWSRRPPIKRPFYQLFGHNAHFGLRHFMEEVSGSEMMLGRYPSPICADDIVQEFSFSVNGEWAEDDFQSAKSFAYATCLDSSASKKLTGVVWPEMEIVQVDF